MCYATGESMGSREKSTTSSIGPSQRNPHVLSSHEIHQHVRNVLRLVFQFTLNGFGEMRRQSAPQTGSCLHSTSLVSTSVIYGTPLGRCAYIL